MTNPGLEFFFDGILRAEVQEIDELQAFLLEVLKEEGCELEVNCVFTTDNAVQSLNRDFRKKDVTTDVLSFPWEGDDELLGEVYISIPQVLRQAPEFGATPKQEIQRVCLHGILHLLGYDHIDEKDRKVMEPKEESYLKRKIY
jgi:probable rRNA maturation factor